MSVTYPRRHSDQVRCHPVVGEIVAVALATSCSRSHAPSHEPRTAAPSRGNDCNALNPMGSDGSVLVGFDWSTGDHPLGSSVIFYVCLSPSYGRHGRRHERQPQINVSRINRRSRRCGSPAARSRAGLEADVHDRGACLAALAALRTPRSRPHPANPKTSGPASQVSGFQLASMPGPAS